MECITQRLINQKKKISGIENKVRNSYIHTVIKENKNNEG